jgi:hypothetical protein
MIVIHLRELTAKQSISFRQIRWATNCDGSSRHRLIHTRDIHLLVHSHFVYHRAFNYWHWVGVMLDAEFKRLVGELLRQPRFPKPLNQQRRV